MIEDTALTRRRLVVSVSALAATAGLAAVAPLSESLSKLAAVPGVVPGVVPEPPIDGPYGFVMIGDSAEPWSRAGDTLYTDPSRELQTGKWCVFWRTNQRTAQVGVLVGMTDEAWHIHRYESAGIGWRPTARQELARSDWPHCHRITARQFA